MNARLSCELLEKYCKCKKCGHDKVGSGNGGIHIFDNTFIRDCRCGHRSIVVVDKEKVIFTLN